ncbi:MAG: mechanosensitive ion channel [Acidobacteria bacterium]|nr:mechanosensitive ion channel [Acidobacteriota bacterium]
MSHFLDSIREFVPTGVAVIVIVLIIFGVRYLIDKRARVHGNVARQVMTMLLSFVGLLIVLMFIPEQHLSETSRGQLLSLIGILLSASIALSSTTFIGNAMAGLMLRSVKSFRPGDFVRVGDHFGRVTERGLFHIEIQNEDRDLTTLPNLYLVTNPVKVILSSGTIISAEVSLGYDVPHTDVEDILKKAAISAGLTDPFVLIIELGDFSVTYRASGMLAEVRHLISIRSKLRAMMLDGLHQAGVEIVSPNFMNTRALAEKERIIPRSAAPNLAEESKVEPAIEKLAFDLADEAESIEKLNQLLTETVNELDALKDRSKEVESDEEKEKIKGNMERLEARREEIERLVRKMNEKKEE